MADNLQAKLQNKEKFLRMLVTLGIIAGAAYGIYIWGQIVPFLIDTATNTLHLVALIAVLGAIAYCVLDNKIRTLASYMWANALRWLFSMFTNIDMIGTLKTYSSRMKDKLKDVDKAIGNLRGQIGDLSKTIDENEDERINALKRAAAAKNIPTMKSRLALEGNKAGRLQRSNVDLRKLLIQITKLHDGLVKRREAMDVTIQDIDSTIDEVARKRKSMLAGYRAMKSAQGVLDHSVDKEIYEMTLEKLADDYADKMGEIETFMDMSKNICDGIDLDNMVFQEDAMAQLDAFEKSKGNVRVATDGTAANTGPRVDGDLEETGPSSFSSLFNDDGSKKQNKAQ
ncbi:MAG: hypothetical protein ACREHV_01925 [Rhizomicrobium sp.]